MPVRDEPPPPANSKQIGVTKSLLYNGSKFQGFQKSKGNSYVVEVVLQVNILSFLSISKNNIKSIHSILYQANDLKYNLHIFIEFRFVCLSDECINISTMEECLFQFLEVF